VSGTGAPGDAWLSQPQRPDLDPALQVNLVWSPTTGLTRESVPAVPDEISALMEEVSTTGRLVEQEVSQTEPVAGLYW
jgi:hypothetical protein